MKGLLSKPGRIWLLLLFVPLALPAHLDARTPTSALEAGKRAGKSLKALRQGRPPEKARDRIIVKLKPGVQLDAAQGLTTGTTSGTASLEEKIARHRVSRIARIVPTLAGQAVSVPTVIGPVPEPDLDPSGLGRIFLFYLPEDNQMAALEELESDPAVEYAEPDIQIWGLLVPNDPRYSSQWAPEKIRVPEAWDLVGSEPAVMVAILDTGVDAGHEDLAGRVVAGYDHANQDADPADDHGHGTHVAGIVGAVVNNGQGIAGVGKNSRIFASKVLDGNNSGWTSWAVSGIQDAVAQGARIINLSVGAPTYSQAFQDAIDYAHSNGCLVVAAAGNQGSDVPSYPAAYQNVLAVGATDSADRRVSNATWGSNFGDYIDLVAPGQSILSTVPGNGYQAWDGTSMAAPHAAGVAALVLAADPGLGPDAIADIIRQTADDQVGNPGEDTPGWDRYHGWGRLNALRAVDLALPALKPPGPPGSNPPGFTSAPADSAIEDADYSYNVVAADPDPGDVLTITGTLPGWLILTDHGNGTATLSGTPGNSDVGSHNVDLTVTDAAGLNDTQTFTIRVTNVNDPPTFTSSARSTATEDTAYSYSISVSDVDAGDSLSLTGIHPGWLSLTDHGNATATLAGTPGNAEVGSHPVTLRVTDQAGAFAEQSFTLTVANVNDPPVFTSTPPSSVGEGNPYSYAVHASDPDAGDSLAITGVTPLWLTLTDHGNGTATLDGTPTAADVADHAVELTVTDAAGLAAGQTFTLTVTASEAFGLECPPAGAGTSCIIREDGGDAAGNLDPATGNPRMDALFRFQVRLTDRSGAAPVEVALVLNGYTQPMSLIAGEPVNGAIYAFTTALGPAPVCAYHFEARDAAGNLVFRHPETGEADGPWMALLNGANMVGLPRDLASSGVTAAQALGTANAYRWVSDGLTSKTNTGYFAQVDESGPPRAGEGYFISRADAGARLPGLEAIPEISAQDFVIPLEPGWNMISNPYSGPVRLADAMVQRGAEAAAPWPQAAENGWVPNAIYDFKGSDWGSTYGYASAGRNPEAVLIPWLGYWLYLARDDASYRLIIPRPPE